VQHRFRFFKIQEIEANMSVLNACHITKDFPGTRALDDVSISFQSGKVNALVGKNGSGKSTLVKIINGAYELSAGTMNIDGEDFYYSSPKQAAEAGIATVYQEMSLIPGLSVAENILMGRYRMKGPFVDWKKTFSDAQAILGNMEVELPIRELVANLSVWQCQVIEFAKAMSMNPKVLFLDEPTSSLAHYETEKLFRLIRRLADKDVIVIYISHRLQELWEIADTCAVLRDGKCVGTLEMKSATQKDLLGLMFGDVAIRERPADIVPGEKTVLKVEGFTCEPSYRDISFELKEGEILGIAGMLGAGRTELLRGIYGVDMADSGSIHIEDSRVTKHTPIEMKKNGLAFIPENRKDEGLVQILSIRDNLNHASLARVTRGLFVDRGLEKQQSRTQVEDLQIKISSDEYPMTTLSGGNQQKVVVGKWLNARPKIFIFDEPSRGIDVNAKQQIFQIVWDLSRRGLSSIVVSSELEELLEICTRIIIMKDGVFISEVNPDDLKVKELYSLCMGGDE